MRTVHANLERGAFVGGNRFKETLYEYQHI